MADSHLGRLGFKGYTSTSGQDFGFGDLSYTLKLTGRLVVTSGVTPKGHVPIFWRSEVKCNVMLY